MNFASMKFFLVGLTLTAMLSACSDDETSDLIPEPSISISALESEIGALNFSINVEKCRAMRLRLHERERIAPHDC